MESVRGKHGNVYYVKTMYGGGCRLAVIASITDLALSGEDNDLRAYIAPMKFRPITVEEIEDCIDIGAPLLYREALAFFPFLAPERKDHD